MKETRLFEDGDITVKFSRRGDAGPWWVDLFAVNTSPVWSGRCADIDATATTAADIIEAHSDALEAHRDAPFVQRNAGPPRQFQFGAAFKF